MRQHSPSTIDRAFPDLALLREAADEAERRNVSAKKLDMIDCKEPRAQAGEVLPPGTVTLVLARRGSEIFKKALVSLRRTGNFDAETNKRIRASYERRKVMALAEAVDLLRGQPTIAEVTGGRFTLASSLFVPEDLDLVLAPMPYNGGRLDDVPFTLIQRHAPGVDLQDYDAILVRRPPVLTAAERAALDLIPRNAFDLNLGRSAMCYAITAVAIVAVVIFATAACPHHQINLHLDDDDIKQLGPEMTARTLVNLRRQALDRRL